LFPEGNYTLTIISFSAFRLPCKTASLMLRQAFSVAVWIFIFSFVTRSLV